MNKPPETAKPIAAICRGYIRFARMLSAAGLTLAATACALMMLLVVFEVSTRKFIPPLGLDVVELSGYALLAISFFGLAHAFVTGRLIRVNIFYRRFSGIWLKIIDFSLALVSSAFAGLLCYCSWRLVFQSMRIEAKSGSLMGIPLQHPQMIISLGLSILFMIILGYMMDRLLILFNIDLKMFEFDGRET